MLTCVIAQNSEVSRCAYFFIELAELWRLTVGLIVPCGVGAERIVVTLNSFSIGSEEKDGKSVVVFCSRV
jgi:hypothetical protein